MTSKRKSPAAKAPTLADLGKAQRALAAGEKRLRTALETALRTAPAGAALGLHVEIADAILASIESRIAALRRYHELVRDVLAKAAR